MAQEDIDCLGVPFSRRCEQSRTPKAGAFGRIRARLEKVLNNSRLAPRCGEDQNRSIVPVAELEVAPLSNQRLHHVHSTRKGCGQKSSHTVLVAGVYFRSPAEKRAHSLEALVRGGMNQLQVP
jgi:hypothetical protein